MKKKIFIIILLIVCSEIHSQSEDLHQFWNEYAFTKDLSQNWVLEIDAGLSSSIFLKVAKKEKAFKQ